MADVKKQCARCAYWGGTNGHNEINHTFSCCHHLLVTGKRRVEEDGVCRSFAKRMREHG